MEALDIRDIKGPVKLISNLSAYFIAGLILLIIIGIILFFLSRKKKKEKMVFMPPKPPHEAAYEALEALKKKHLIENGRIKEFYIELSFIVRRYLEYRFNLRAPEMTTEEFLIHVKNRNELSYDEKYFLKNFLSHCDIVKFAKYVPTAKEIDSSFDSAKNLIDETKNTDDRRLETQMITDKDNICDHL